NPYMVAHPPMLYLGYVGLTVPFAFAMGALLSKRTDERWIVATRRWTLAAWAFLGVGQLLGAHWAYVEVGWGGYYAWDPVENAALMPWLAATAFLHSVMIQEKRGMLKVWNVLLVILAFSLSLFGTFLTRSGVVNSIHSFTESSIGPWFLAFIAVTVAVSLSVVFWRLPQLRSLATTFRGLTAVALATGVVLLFLGAGGSVPGLVAYTFSAFVLATIVLEFARGTRARKALGATSWPSAFGSLVSRNRRRY